MLPLSTREPESTEPRTVTSAVVPVTDTAPRTSVPVSRTVRAPAADSPPRSEPPSTTREAPSATVTCPRTSAPSRQSTPSSTLSPSATVPVRVSVHCSSAPGTTVARKGPRVVRSEIRGALTVTDPERLVETMGNGIGHGRAYGCGLLLTR
ncbi:MAG: type I-E CRISPR-associated protein Cas6/Cse3/CasE [Nocardiopsis sp. BM-2018]|nr:MAG: type I-E CRISPR-associated protein Cas6/Cse3/CasE [Nocardiopsis sp. BM-2018]